MRVQSEVAGIERAVFDAVVQGEAHQVNVLDPALLQKMREPGVAAMHVIEKRAVAIDLWVDPLVENVSDSARVECGGKLCAVGVLNAVHRPQDLFDTVENDAITRFAAS